MKRQKLESIIQKSIIEYWQFKNPKYKNCLFHVPNGGKRGISEAAELKREGVTAGVTDLILMWMGTVYFIELKQPKGVMSTSQKLFRDAVINQNLQHRLFKSLDEFIEFTQQLPEQK